MNLTILKISVPKFITGLLHKRNQNVVEDQMIVTADERRNVLNLFNVSEAARQLGVDVQQMHRDIRTGRVRPPGVRVGKRLYFTSQDMNDLSAKNQMKDIENVDNNRPD